MHEPGFKHSSFQPRPLSSTTDNRTNESIDFGATAPWWTARQRGKIGESAFPSGAFTDRIMKPATKWSAGRREWWMGGFRTRHPETSRNHNHRRRNRPATGIIRIGKGHDPIEKKTEHATARDFRPPSERGAAIQGERWKPDGLTMHTVRTILPAPD